MVEEYITYMTRDDLLKRVQNSRRDFIALWEGLSEAQMTQRPGPQADWSIKDLIAHIAWWENFAVTRARTLQETGKFTETTDANVDDYNAQIFQTYHDKSLADVFTFLEYSRDLIFGYIESLTDEEINKDIDSMKVLYYIISNTFGHYADHEDDLRNFIKSLTNY